MAKNTKNGIFQKRELGPESIDIFLKKRSYIIYYGSSDFFRG